MGVSGPAPPPPPGSPEPTAGTGPARRPPLSPPARCSPPAAHGRTCRSTVLGVTFTVWRRPFGASTDTAEPPPPAGAAMFRPRDPPPPPAQLQTTLSVTAGTDSHAAAGRSRRALPDTPGPRPRPSPTRRPGPAPCPGCEGTGAHAHPNSGGLCSPRRVAPTTRRGRLCGRKRPEAWTPRPLWAAALRPVLGPMRPATVAPPVQRRPPCPCPCPHVPSPLRLSRSQGWCERDSPRWGAQIQ